MKALAIWFGPGIFFSLFPYGPDTFLALIIVLAIIGSIWSFTEDDAETSRDISITTIVGIGSQFISFLVCLMLNSMIYSI